jgi:hypothetical protein
MAGAFYAEGSPDISDRCQGHIAGAMRFLPGLLSTVKLFSANDAIRDLSFVSIRKRGSERPCGLPQETNLVTKPTWSSSHEPRDNSSLLIED